MVKKELIGTTMKGLQEVNDSHRHRLELSCRLFFFGDDDFEGEGRLLDISTNGCQMASSESLQVGMLLKLSLFLPDHLWPMRIDQALVRWANEGQYALEFTSIRLAQRERLRAMIMKGKPSAFRLA
jgi:hypothetical protein